MRISPGRRRLLEAGGDVDRVAADEALAARGVAGDHLARVDAGARLERDPVAPLELLVELGERRAHVGRGPHRAQRVVLAHRRHAEHGHDRVADELLDRRPRGARATPLIAPKYDAITCRSVSGSRRSPSSVESQRSQKTTVTILRSACGGGPLASARPQAEQNRAPSGASAPQLGHPRTPESTAGGRRAGDVGSAAEWRTSTCASCEGWHRDTRFAVDGRAAHRARGHRGRRAGSATTPSSRAVTRGSRAARRAS